MLPYRLEERENSGVCSSIAYSWAADCSSSVINTQSSTG